VGGDLGTGGGPTMTVKEEYTEMTIERTIERKGKKGKVSEEKIVYYCYWNRRNMTVKLTNYVPLDVAQEFLDYIRSSMKDTE